MTHAILLCNWHKTSKPLGARPVVLCCNDRPELRSASVSSLPVVELLDSIRSPSRGLGAQNLRVRPERDPYQSISAAFHCRLRPPVRLRPPITALFLVPLLSPTIDLHGLATTRITCRFHSHSNLRHLPPSICRFAAQAAILTHTTRTDPDSEA
jgi:hypothetical protein